MKSFNKNVKKSLSAFLTMSLLLTLNGVSAKAGDTWPFKGDSAQGVNQPSVHGYTSGQIKDWAPESDPDAEQLRSRVPLQQRINAFAQTQANPSLNSNVKMLDLAGDYGNAFIENAPYTNKFAQYHFNFWQYVDFYSYWHGTATAYTPPSYYDELGQKDWTQKWFEFGCLNIPNPTYTDAAHKNGVMSLACIFFSNSDRGQQTYKQMLVKDGDGKYLVANKLVEMAKYLGYDGYFFNQEESGPNVASADIPDYIAFLKVLQKAGLYVQWYDAVNTSTGSTSYNRKIDDSNISWLYDRTSKEPVTNSFFFDYGVGSSQIDSTNTYLNNLNKTYGTNYNIFDVGFAGLEAGRDRWNNSLSSKLSSGLPAVSIATLGADFVHAGLDEDMGLSWPVSHRSENDYQWMTNVRERLWWSGPNQDPKNTTKSASNTVSDVYANNSTSWTGVSSVISERSVIGGTNFYTNFNTGHGLSYYVNGQVSNKDEWSNMSLQDIPVTWQWWQDTTGNKLEADFDYGPGYTMTGNTQNRFTYQKIGGYNGGSSLVVDGNLNAEDFLHLYKTELNINANSKLSIVYNKPSENDASTMSAGLIFKDDPSTVVKVPVVNSGNKTSGWTSAELDLSAYTGKTIAAFGLVFNNGESTINNYQMNIGQIRIYDGSAIKPSAPTGLKITDVFTNTNEMNIKWDMDTDYSKVKQYNIYVNDTYVGGKYDSSFYIKKLPAKSGTIKVIPVCADGLEGTPAQLSFDLNKAVTNISVESKEDGTFKVSWTNPTDASGNISVNVKSINLKPESVTEKQTTVSSGSTSASFTGMPINGDDYIVQIAVGSNNPVSISSNFIDKTCDPYAEKWSWNGSTLNLPMPNTRDWRYMYVYEDGVAKQFATTYSQGNKPMIIRGRSTKDCLSFTSTAQTVYVVMEDYAGNKSTPLYVKTTEVSSSYFPDPILLQWVKDTIGSTMDKVLSFTGTLELSGLEIKDFTGLRLFANATGLNLSKTPITLLDQNMLPPRLEALNLTDCKDLLYIRERAFTGINSLKTLNITDCNNLKLLSLKGSSIDNLIYSNIAAFPNLIVLDLSGTPLNVKVGAPARIFADYIKKQIIQGQTISFPDSGVISTINSSTGYPKVSGTFYNADNMFDGNTTGTYGYYWGNGDVILDFGSDIQMTGLKFYAAWGYYYAPTDFSLYYSTDGINYTQIGSSTSGNNSQNYECTFATPVTGRYFKFVVDNSLWGSVYLNELQVYGIVNTIYESSVMFNGWDGLVSTSNAPANNAYDVGLEDPLKISFADNVAAGSGNITIYNATDDSVFQTIPAASKLVTTSGDTATIAHNKFVTGKTYYVFIDSGAFKDLSDVPYKGMTTKTNWSFTVVKTVVKVDLTNYFDIDGFSYDTNKADGNFDGGNYSYSADLAEAANPISFEGVSYQFGSFAQGNKNIIKCSGQTIDIDDSPYGSIAILSSATNGKQTGTFTINYSDSTTKKVDITVNDWCSTSTKNTALAMNHRHSASADNSIKCGIYAYYLTPESDKIITSITLPSNSNIKVMALSVVTNEKSIVYVKGISLNKSSISLNWKGTEQLSASILPDIATNKEVKWSVTSGSDVASVSSTGLVTALKLGKAVIRATSEFDNSIYAECEVSIDPVKIPPEITLNINDQDVLPVGTKIVYSSADTHNGGDVAVTAKLTLGSTEAEISSGYLPTPGVYQLKITSKDIANNIAEKTVNFVIYDPNGGFVTGGGWISSPAGAYTQNSKASGKASFELVSKYNKGSKTPSSEVTFIFDAGNMVFNSSSCQWLVISGSKAQLEGTGTINGQGKYGFMVTTIDGGSKKDKNSDRFRIKIWDVVSGNVIYDNQPNTPASADLTGQSTLLGGGSIVIHK